MTLPDAFPLPRVRVTWQLDWPVFIVWRCWDCRRWYWPMVARTYAVTGPRLTSYSVLCARCIAAWREAKLRRRE